MRLTSTQNPRIKHIRKLLRQKKTREQSGEFVVEGTQSVQCAAVGGWEIRALLFDPDASLTDTAIAAIDATDPSSRLPVDGSVLDYLSDRPNPGELLAVVGCRSSEASQIVVDENALIVLLESPRDPGNVGAIIRTGDAIGATAIALVGDSVDIYAPKTVRATMGSLFATPLAAFTDVSGVWEWLEDAKVRMTELRLIGTSPTGAQAIDAVDLTGPTVLAVGNERKGLTDELADLCDVVASIPMSGSAESLNSAVSASIVMYEAMRQRRSGSAS